MRKLDRIIFIPVASSSFSGSCGIHSSSGRARCSTRSASARDQFEVTMLDKISKKILSELQNDDREFLGKTLLQLKGVRETHTYAVMEEVKHTTKLPIK